MKLAKSGLLLNWSLQMIRYFSGARPLFWFTDVYDANCRTNDKQ
jgi:hypothetical protein